MPHAKDKINLKRIEHVYYTHKDLDKAYQFLLDFGFTATDKRPDKIFYRGYGTSPFIYCAVKGEEDVFGGAAFAVDSMEDLELAFKILPRATSIHDVDVPGGGKRVTFYDPVDGFPFHLVFGQEEVEMTAHLPELEFNFPENKHRPVNKTQRFKQDPAPIYKLGHFGCVVTDVAKTLKYTPIVSI